ncbi:MAG: hypothetical protein WBA00_12130 [Rhodococcus sp. (in: high G+C Gram-positive bacteria)]
MVVSLKCDVLQIVVAAETLSGLMSDGQVEVAEAAEPLILAGS